MKLVQTLKKILIISMLALLSAGLLAFWLSASQNNLDRNGNWIVSKADLYVPSMGGPEFAMSRATLAGNKLSLGKYYGYHEVFFKQVDEYEEYSLKFKINEKSYLDLIFELNDNIYKSIRITNRPEHKIIITSDSSGKIIYSELYAEKHLRPHSWNAAKLIKENADLVLYINNNKVKAWNNNNKFMNRIGVRAGRDGAIVDDIYLRTKDGREIKESFFNSNYLSTAVLRSLLFVGASFLIIGALLFLLKREIKIDFFVGVFALLVLLSAFDYFYYSRLPVKYEKGKISLLSETNNKVDLENTRHDYFRRAWTFLSKENLLEKKRKAITDLSKTFKFCLGTKKKATKCSQNSLADMKLRSPKKTDIGIYFMGGSFTSHSGARNEEDVFTHLVFERLLEKYPQKTVSMISDTPIFTWGGPLATLTINNFFEVAEQYKINTLVITFIVFLEKERPLLSKLIKYCNENNIEIVFLEQPINREPTETETFVRQYAGDEKEPLTLASGKQVAQVFLENRVKVISATDELLRAFNENKGHVWWDSNHVKPYGHRLIFEKLEKEINLLKK